MIRKIIVLSLLVIAFVTVNLHAAPFKDTFTLSNTAGEYTATPVYNSVSTGVRISYIVFSPTATGTVQVAFISGVSTSASSTKVISATDRMLVVTNIPPLFMGDKVKFTTNDTGTNTNNGIIGEEF